MARCCDITGKKTTNGNNVSHSKRRVKRTFKPNIHKKTYLIPG
ncbi:MAG: 50S ribosomal protein L28, partial [Legionellales bacterium]|nr:50S ribosomal protein L28 [Legionellales bacterium]